MGKYLFFVFLGVPLFTGGFLLFKYSNRINKDLGPYLKGLWWMEISIYLATAVWTLT